MHIIICLLQHSLHSNIIAFIIAVAVRFLMPTTFIYVVVQLLLHISIFDNITDKRINMCQ